MENKLFDAAGPGAGAAKESFASSFQLPTAFVTCKAFIRQIVLLLLCGAAIFSPLLAQDTLQYDLADLGFEIVAPNVRLDSGETATFSVRTTEAVKDAIAYRVALGLGASTAEPARGDFDFADAWFPAGTPQLSWGGGEVVVDATTAVPTTGSGPLFQLTLESNADNVPAAQLIAGGGGHVLIVIEDIGFKQAPAPKTDTDGPVFFPNPCTTQLQFNWHGEVPTRATFYNLQGQAVLQLDPSQLELGRIEGLNLPTGRYQIVLESAEHLERVHTLIVR